MLEPQYLPDPEPPQVSPRRQRQERTTYTQEQLRLLDTQFEKNKYPDYNVRKALADRLSLQDHQVQVWFKNRRAKYARQQRLQGQLQQQRLWGQGAQEAPGKCSRAPTPAGPAFPRGSGFCNPGPSSPLAVFPAAEPAGFSPSQSFRAPAQGAQLGARGARATRAPACTQGFSLDPASCPDFMGIFSYQVPFGRSFLIHDV